MNNNPPNPNPSVTEEMVRAGFAAVPNRLLNIGAEQLRAIYLAMRAADQPQTRLTDVERVKHAVIETFPFLNDADADTLARAAIAALLVSDRSGVERDLNFIWKWVERAMFDKDIGMKNALDTLANYPGAPWKSGRWDVDHKPYAEAFYAKFPKAAPIPEKDKQ